MKFRVLRRHIDHGKRLDCHSCPVALCLHEALNDCDFTVDGDTIHHAKQDKVNIYLPDSVHEWINDFDSDTRQTFEDWVNHLREDVDFDEIDAQTEDWIKTECMKQEIEFEIDLSGYVPPSFASVLHPETGLPLLEHYEAKTDDFENALMQRWKAREISETEWETTFDPHSSKFCQWEVQTNV